MIYLGIDGAMLPGRVYRLFGNECLIDPTIPEFERMQRALFDPEALHCLRYLVRNADAKIVIVSSWQKSWHHHQDALKQKFVAQGIDKSSFHENWFPYQKHPPITFDKAHLILSHFHRWRPWRGVVIDSTADQIFLGNRQVSSEQDDEEDDGFLPPNRKLITTNPKIGFDSARLRKALDAMR